MEQDQPRPQEGAQELGSSEVHFRTLFESAPIGMATVDAEGRALQVNRAGAKMFAMDRDQFIGSLCRDLTDPRDRSVSDRLFSELVEGKRDQYRMLKRYRTSEGKVLWGDTSVHAVRDAEGRFLFAIPMVVDVTKEKGVEQQLRISRLKLQALSHQLLDAQEKERQAIARDLHDEIGQALTALQLELGGLKQSRGDESFDSVVKGLLESVDQILQQVRTLSFNLRPILLDEVGLTAAVHEYCTQRASASGVELRLDLDDLERPAPPGVELACYRIAQEAVTNAARHAEASTWTVRIRVAPQELRLLVRDDGRGFEHEEASGERSHFGLLTMQERARFVGGDLKIESSPGTGTTVRARLPLEVRG